MKHYTAEDFRRYYGHAFITNPANEKQVGQMVYGGDGRFYFSTKEAGNVPLNHELLEWRHVRCPYLGYVHLDDGHRFYHTSKTQIDGTPKGLNPAVVNVVMPMETRVSMQHTKFKMPAMKPALNQEVAQALIAEDFVSLDYAIDKLFNSEHAMGFALSRDAGLTLGLKSNEQLIGLYRGRKACTSRDGKRWTPAGEWAEGIISRHFRR